MRVQREPSAEQIAREKLYREMGLTDEEYDRIVHLLGRQPKYVETGMFAAMWSEHCSYKNSKPVLRLFPTDGARVLQGPGEGAGIVDIGDGQAVVFKIESHNHPSAVDPFNGAATGVGGIVRDVFSMGARPIALLNSLRFGPLHDARVRELFRGVTAGIAHYGKVLGVPTVGGEVAFDESYRGNPLVNAMCVGLIEHGHRQRGIAKGEGNAVVYAGRPTCRDGIQGATFASEALNEEAGRKDTRVPTGDPELERRLMEACLELVARGLVEGIQDMGAAGLTSSSTEMAAKGNCGMVLDLDCVPQAEDGMTPYEMMLSETQERMLLIVSNDRLEEVKAVFDEWDVPTAVIGRVTGDGAFVLRYKGQEVSRLPVRTLVNDAPVYNRESIAPDWYGEGADTVSVPAVHEENVGAALRKVLQSPTVASKAYVYDQFTSVGGDSVVVPPGSDAAVVRIPGREKALALAVDGNARYVSLDPYTGGAIAVAEAARNVVCAGGRPIALTDGLNFGNPENPHIFWELKQCVAGMSDACKAFDTPVISGNVSLYNETDGAAIRPTPIVGMVGLIDDVSKVTTQSFREAGDVIILLGETLPELGGSEYQYVVTGKTSGRPPKIDLEQERSVQQTTLQAIEKGVVKSAHDLSEGGLAIAVSEACIGKRLGASVTLHTSLTVTEVLFSESQSRILVTTAKDDAAVIVQLAEENGVPCAVIGEVKGAGSPLEVRVNGKTVVQEDVSELAHLWEGAIACSMNRPSTD